jgi:UDP-N-acetylmuramoyl-tripeptide--D-alanyl-D-alanine ligase
VSRLYATGDLAREAVAAFGAGATHVDDVPSLALLLQREAHAGVTLLVKGSRFMRMERVVAALAGQAAGKGH